MPRAKWIAEGRSPTWGFQRPSPRRCRPCCCLEAAAAHPKPSQRGSRGCPKLQLCFPSPGLFLHGRCKEGTGKAEAAWPRGFGNGAEACPPGAGTLVAFGAIWEGAVCHLGSYHWNVCGVEKAGGETEAALVQIRVSSHPVPVSAGTLLAPKESPGPSARSGSSTSVLRADGWASCDLGSFYSKTRSFVPLKTFLTLC